MSRIQRRDFLKTGAVVLAPAFVLASSTATGQDADQRPAPLADDLVREFVGVSHSNIDRARELLDEQPRLIRAVWDWGNGDFESGLGAASHVGYPEMAQMLLGRGAPIDLFAAAMLGHLDIVTTNLEAFPELLHVPGPHGIPLVAHARVGGIAAEPVLDYLEKKLAEAGSVVEPMAERPIPAGDLPLFCGTYRAESDGDATDYRIVSHRTKLYLQRLPGWAERRLYFQGEDRFEFFGANSSLQFIVENGDVTAFVLTQRSRETRAERIGD